MANAELIFDGKQATGESPVWVPEEHALYWVDTAAKRIGQWHAGSGATGSWLLPEMVGCIAHRSDRQWVAALESGVFSVTLNAEYGLNKRVSVDMNPLPDRPDGAAVDADGCYWICGNDGGLIHRFTPEGKLDRSLAVPVKKPTMCGFRGVNLDALFVTSIRPGGVDLSDQPLAGGVFALQPSVCGITEPNLTCHH